MIIYKITNLINNKIYIGLTTKTIKERWRNHLKCCKHTQYAIHRAIRKYGKENFIIEQIDFAETIEDLIVLETKYITTLDSINPRIGYNMMYQNDSIKYFNDETRKKISESLKDKYKNLTKEQKYILKINRSKFTQGRNRSGSTSKYSGVYKNKIGTFDIAISYLGKRIRTTSKEEDAGGQIYDKLAIYLYGNDARLNFPEKICEYLDCDLESFVDGILNSDNYGRPAENGYLYNKLPKDSKNIACLNLETFLMDNSPSDVNMKNLMNIKFYYNGNIHNPDFLLKHDQ